MTEPVRRRSAARIVLIAVLSLVAIVLVGAAIVLIPILTHTSGGSSGQEIPEEFVAESTADGEDGRTRTLSVSTPDGEPAELGEIEPGDELVVRGSGFDAQIGIYVSFCAIPESPDVKPGPCLGGIPEVDEEGDAAGEGAEPLASAWVTDDWAWRTFATHQYSDPESGSFEVVLTVPEPTGEGIDCTAVECALVTRADHTAAKDRVQDMLLPIRFAGAE